MEGASEIFLMQPPPPGRDSGKHSDLTSSLFSIRALYARYLSIQALVLALFLTFVGVNSYVLSHGVRKSTLICISFFSLILYSRATSGVSYRRLYVVMLVPPFFHTNTVLMRLACTMIVDPKV